MKKLIFFFLFLTQLAQAQITVSTIVLSGNTITQNDIVIRELSFEKNVNYTIVDLDKKIEESKKNLINLKLFNFVTINKTENKDSTEITIEVIEKWYIWPYPVFEISERNFNTWWEKFSSNNYSDFSRLNYGMFFNWENFRGRNEMLKLKIRKGFKEHYLLAYEVPYFNKNKTIGINTNLQLFRRKQTHFSTEENKLNYLKSDTFNSIDYDLNTEITYRKHLHQTHKLKFTYLHTIINDSIAKLNSNYLGNNLSKSSIYTLEYIFEYENRDHINYPLNGFALNVAVKKHLSSTNNVKHFEFSTKIEKYIESYRRLYIGSSLKAKCSTEGNQPYFIQKALGYNDYVRGYEYYVVDGQSYWLSKTAIKYALVEKTTFDIPYLKMKQFNKSHYSIYLGVFSDLGYVVNNQNQEHNSINHSTLWGKGIALDYVTYYDKLLRIEYSINALEEKGVFLHFSSPF